MKNPTLAQEIFILITFIFGMVNRFMMLLITMSIGSEPVSIIKFWILPVGWTDGIKD